VWDKVFRSNRHVPAEDGDDMHLFTVNAATHVHLSVSRNEVVPAVNVLNGFAGPQIALTAHSNVWKGALDHRYRCVAEKFWEWWIPEEDRVGMPAHPFADLREYCRTVAEFQPVYVKRDGEPVALPDYDSFADYFATTTAVGVNSRGERVVVAPQPEDIALHNSCYWFNARLSRYHTVENRVNDQQPPGELLAVPALTLGLISALGEAEEELRSYDWSLLQEARRASCRAALRARVNGIALRSLASRMLDIADRGLRARNQGEEAFLEPLQARIRDSRCPADETAKLYRRGGISALLTDRAL